VVGAGFKPAPTIVVRIQTVRAYTADA